MRTLLVAAALTIGVTGAALAEKPLKKAPGEDWKISGWETTTCCCNDICPCRFNEKPTHMECESFIAIHVDKGNYGKTQLSDVNFILAGRGFDDNGPGWSKVYMDKKVSPAEQKAVVGILTSIVSTYSPEKAKKIFGAENKGMQVVPITMKKANNGLVRTIEAPGVCSIKARLGKVPNSAKPMHILGVLTEFSPIFYPAAEVSAKAAEAVGFDHPDHHRAEVEDFTLTRDDYTSKKIGFQAYTGKGGCLLPGKGK